MMGSASWTSTFRRLFEGAAARYRSGQREPATYFTEDELTFLASIGLPPMAVYDYAEDLTLGGAPDWETVLLLASARRDYFLYEQRGEPAEAIVIAEDLPPKEAELGGIAWLPRILAKARGFLEGALPPEIMYCCGGDRNFLTRHGIHPADFLRATWAAGDDDQRMLAFVRGTDQPPAGRTRQ